MMSLRYKLLNHTPARVASRENKNVPTDIRVRCARKKNELGGPGNKKKSIEIIVTYVISRSKAQDPTRQNGPNSRSSETAST